MTKLSEKPGVKEMLESLEAERKAKRAQAEVDAALDKLRKLAP